MRVQDVLASTVNVVLLKLIRQLSLVDQTAMLAFVTLNTWTPAKRNSH
jgi:hypothetical protein